MIPQWDRKLIEECWWALRTAIKHRKLLAADLIDEADKYCNQKPCRHSTRRHLIELSWMDLNEITRELLRSKNLPPPPDLCFRTNGWPRAVANIGNCWWALQLAVLCREAINFDLIPTAKVFGIVRDPEPTTDQLTAVARMSLREIALRMALERTK